MIAANLGHSRILASFIKFLANNEALGKEILTAEFLIRERRFFNNLK